MTAQTIARLMPALLGSSVLLAASTARSEYNPFCASAPRAHWLSHEEIKERLKESGFRLVRLRMADDRCYAVLVKDDRGRSHDFIIHPVTAEFVR